MVRTLGRCHDRLSSLLRSLLTACEEEEKGFSSHLLALLGSIYWHCSGLLVDRGPLIDS
jgi:hypothetical protein